MTKVTHTSADSSTIKQYEKVNHVTGVTLIVDHSQPLDKEFTGKNESPILPYDTQISEWKKGYTEERVNSDTLPHGECLPEGWYLVKYKAVFYDGKHKVIAKRAFHLNDIEAILGILSALVTIFLFLGRRKK